MTGFVRDWSCAAVLVALCAIAGCASPPGQVSGEHFPVIGIRADLADGTTNAGQGPFKVSYSDYGLILDDAALGRLTARLALRTWPEGTDVPTVVTIGPIAPSNNNVPENMAVVEIAPSSALEDRWYSLQFGPAEKGIRTSQSFDGGVPGIRLRPGAHPAVRLIQFCQASVPGGKFVVDFSEPVTAASPAEIFTVTQNGVLLDCPSYDFRPQTLFEFCSTLVPGPVTVTLVAGKVHGAGGESLAPGTWSFDTSKLPSVESGCVGYLVELQ